MNVKNLVPRSFLRLLLYQKPFILNRSTSVAIDAFLLNAIAKLLEFVQCATTITDAICSQTLKGYYRVGRQGARLFQPNLGQPDIEGMSY